MPPIELLEGDAGGVSMLDVDVVAEEGKGLKEVGMECGAETEPLREWERACEDLWALLLCILDGRLLPSLNESICESAGNELVEMMWHGTDDH